MTLPTVGTIAYPTAQEVRDGMLRTIKLGLARQGIETNVLPGSDHFVRCDAIARRLMVAYANNKIGLEDLNPLTAGEEALPRIAGVFGVYKRAPSKASGYVVIVSSGTVTIPAGYRCVAPTGELYETTTVVTVSNGGTVEVQAINTGKSTNQTVGTQLAWTSAAVGALGTIATVAAGDIDGGEPEDDTETLRRRLLERLANPSVGGNNANVKAIVEGASAGIEAAYVFAALRGPSSADVAVTKAGGDRTLSDAVVDLAEAAVRAALPGHADLNVTAVDGQSVDVVLRATLPLPATSGGSGGGWRDGAPWPSGTPAAGSNDGKVTAYTAPTATVRATTAPTVGGNIGVWDSTALTMREYVLTSVGGVSGAYTITVQGLEGAAGFKASPLGAYVSAGAVNLGAYAAKMLAEMLLLGPGEKTESLELLPRAARYPAVDNAHPNSLDNRILGKLQEAHPELVAEYGLRLDTGTATARTTPSIPTTTTDPPKVLTLAEFAIWQA